MDKDQDKRPSTGRKVKYAPKAPRPSRTQLPAPETETKNEGAEAQAQKLMRQFNEANTRQRPKPEKKSPQVAFDPGATSSTGIRTFGAHRDGSGTKGTDSGIKDYTSDDRQIVISSPSIAKEDGSSASSSDASGEDYIEPWDYEHTYYPTTLPWRPPNSGDPELLNEAEFGEAARNLEYDESTINDASELGLLEESEEKKMLFFQLPRKLPLGKQSASTKGKEKAESSKALGRVDALKKSCSLEELPKGFMGKILVYKSGAVKLKLGENLLDVGSGLECSMVQSVAAINIKEQTCCHLGELGKHRAVVSPHIPTDGGKDAITDLGRTCKPSK